MAKSAAKVKATAKPNAKRVPKTEIVVAKIVLSDEALRLLTADEQNLFILLSVAANELSALARIITAAGHGSVKKEINDDFTTSQYLTLIKVYAGKIHECWRLLQRRYYSTRISLYWDVKVGNECRANLDFLKRYFGASGNIVSTLRNEFAFHYTDRDVQSSMKRLIDDSSHVYVGAYCKHIRLYWAGEVAFHNHLFSSIEYTTGKKPKEVHDEVAMMGGILASVLDDLLWSIIVKITELQQNRMYTDFCVVNPTRSLKTSTIPLFVDPFEYAEEQKALRRSLRKRQSDLSRLDKLEDARGSSLDRYLQILARRKIKL